jgi:hypothetical protein
MNGSCFGLDLVTEYGDNVRSPLGVVLTAAAITRTTWAGKAI